MEGGNYFAGIVEVPGVLVSKLSKPKARDKNKSKEKKKRKKNTEKAKRAGYLVYIKKHIFKNFQLGTPYSVPTLVSSPYLSTLSTEIEPEKARPREKQQGLTQTDYSATPSSL